MALHVVSNHAQTTVDIFLFTSLYICMYIFKVYIYNLCISRIIYVYDV